MYTLVSAIGEPLGGDSRWREVSIGSIPMNELYSTYTNVFAVLTNSFVTGQLSLDLSLIRAAHGTKTLTFNELLASLGSAALPTSTTIPSLNTRFARYADAHQAGYKIQPIHPSWAPDAQVPPSERSWLHITRPRTDFGLFHRSCMVSINGLWHWIDGDGQGIYVKDGDISRQLSGQNNVGIYSFRELGELTYLPITPEMVYKQKPEQKLRHRAYLDIGQDITNKTVLLVLGGYLHVMDAAAFSRTGKQTLAVHLENLPLFERYHESMGLIDWSGIPLERTERNAWQIGVDNFLSDEALRAYLTMAQSFVVLLDNPSVFVSRLPIHTTRMPGMFTSFIRPDYPMIAGYGLSPNYWHTYEDTQYSLTCVGGVRDEYLHQTVDARNQHGLSDARNPMRRRRLSAAHFLQIGRDI